MAGGMDLGQGAKGRKKPLDMAINLVPFIDLMAVTIVFLIMTAVWTQLGRLRASTSGPSEGDAPPTPDVPVAILVTGTAVTLSVGGAPPDRMSIVRDAKGRLEVAALTTKLTELKRELPDRASITLTSEDEVPYDDLVRLLDTCIGSGFPAVDVSPAGKP